MSLSLLFSKFVDSLIFKVIEKYVNFKETIAMSKIYHILNMEALCQTIKILRLRYCCFYFDNQTEEKGKLTKIYCQKVL